MEVHTEMFEVAPNRTPTPLAAVEAEHAQGRQSSDLIFFPHLTFLFDLFNILIPWDSSCEQGGKPKVVSRCDASMFSLHPRKTNTASLGKGENVCCLWCKIESWDSKTQVLLPCCPCDFSKAQLF